MVGAVPTAIACQCCSNNIFILNLTPDFNGLGKCKCKKRWETFKSCDFIRDFLVCENHLIEVYSIFKTLLFCFYQIWWVWSIWKVLLRAVWLWFFLIVYCLIVIFLVVYCLIVIFLVVYCLIVIFLVVYCLIVIFLVVYCLIVIFKSSITHGSSWSNLVKVGWLVLEIDIWYCRNWNQENRNRAQSNLFYTYTFEGYYNTPCNS